MNWTKRTSNNGILISWVTDCGCKVSRYTDITGKRVHYVPRNSHGSRIIPFGESFDSVESAKACVEQYIAQRTDAGLYPYNR